MKFNTLWHVQCLNEDRFNNGTCDASYVNHWHSDTHANAKPYCCKICGSRNIVAVKTMRDLPGDLNRVVWDDDFRAHGVADMVRSYIDFEIQTGDDLSPRSIY